MTSGWEQNNKYLERCLGHFLNCYSIWISLKTLMYFFFFEKFSDNKMAVVFWDPKKHLKNREKFNCLQNKFLLFIEIQNSFDILMEEHNGTLISSNKFTDKIKSFRNLEKYQIILTIQCQNSSHFDFHLKHWTILKKKYLNTKFFRYLYGKTKWDSRRKFKDKLSFKCCCFLKKYFKFFAKKMYQKLLFSTMIF